MKKLYLLVFTLVSIQQIFTERCEQCPLTVTGWRSFIGQKGGLKASLPEQKQIIKQPKAVEKIGVESVGKAKIEKEILIFFPVEKPTELKSVQPSDFKIIITSPDNKILYISLTNLKKSQVLSAELQKIPNVESKATIRLPFTKKDLEEVFAILKNPPPAEAEYWKRLSLKDLIGNCYLIKEWGIENYKNLCDYELKKRKIILNDSKIQYLSGQRLMSLPKSVLFEILFKPTSELLQWPENKKQEYTEAIKEFYITDINEKAYRTRLELKKQEKLEETTAFDQIINILRPDRVTLVTSDNKTILASVKGLEKSPELLNYYIKNYNFATDQVKLPIDSAALNRLQQAVTVVTLLTIDNEKIEVYIKDLEKSPTLLNYYTKNYDPSTNQIIIPLESYKVNRLLHDLTYNYDKLNMPEYWKSMSKYSVQDYCNDADQLGIRSWKDYCKVGLAQNQLAAIFIQKDNEKKRIFLPYPFIKRIVEKPETFKDEQDDYKHALRSFFATFGFQRAIFRNGTDDQLIETMQKDKSKILENVNRFIAQQQKLLIGGKSQEEAKEV